MRETTLPAALAGDAPRVAPAYSPRAIMCLLVAATCYLGLLSALNAHVLRVSPALVGLVEALIYAACFWQIARALSPRMVLGWVIVVAVLALLWLVRQQPDVKGLRDLIIPLLFFALGRYVADPRFADALLLRILLLLLLVGVFEAVALNTFATVFNTFSFYVNLGSINESAAMFQGQGLTLNGFRPEGIGRTLLPWLLGNHRVSSLMMDPVSLGNFAVIALAWALSNTERRSREQLAIIGCAMGLLILADSRFGALMFLVMLGMRLIPVAFVDRAAPLAPVLAGVATIGLALFRPSYGDNLFGRLTGSGRALLGLSPAEVFGVSAPLPVYGDMGYAYALTRFGLPLAVVLVASLFLQGGISVRARYFRALSILYVALILTVSGSSLFALKTAAMLWFLLGVVCQPRAAGSAVRREARQ